METEVHIIVLLLHSSPFPLARPSLLPLRRKMETGVDSVILSCNQIHTNYCPVSYFYTLSRRRNCVCLCFFFVCFFVFGVRFKALRPRIYAPCCVVCVALLQLKHINKSRKKIGGGGVIGRGGGGEQKRTNYSFRIFYI